MKRLVLLLITLATVDYVGIDTDFTRCLDNAKNANEAHLCEVDHPKTVVCLAKAHTDQEIADCLMEGE